MKTLCVIVFSLVALLPCEAAAGRPLPHQDDVFCRVSTPGGARYARLSAGSFQLLDKAPWAGGRETGERAPSTAALLPPAEPRTILGLAGAYIDPTDDLPPTIRWFAKSASAAATDGDDVTIPPVLTGLKVEAELVLVIGKRVKEADAAEAGDAIFGYATGTEIFGSAEDYRKVTGDAPERREQMLAAGLKLGDKFAPFGPCIHTGIDWRNRDRSLVIRDAAGKERVRYRNSMNGLRLPPAQIVSDLSKVMTLEPGDLIFTGTTEAFIVHPGETVVTSVEGLGTLTNPIVRQQTGGKRQ